MKRNKLVLKSYFETGDRPTQQNYEDLIDSYHHLDESLIFVAQNNYRHPYSDDIFYSGLFKNMREVVIGNQQSTYIGAMQFFDCILKISRLDNPNEFGFFKVISIAKNYIRYTSWSGYEIRLDHLVSSGSMEEGALYKVDFIITGAKNLNQSYYYYNGLYIGTI